MVTKRFEHVENTGKGKLLHNQVTAALDSMGRSISTQEKRQILMEILKTNVLINGGYKWLILTMQQPPIQSQNVYILIWMNFIVIMGEMQAEVIMGLAQTAGNLIF